MPTFHITLSESLHQFVTDQIAEQGFDHSDQYFEQLLEQAMLPGEGDNKFDDHCMKKVQEAIDQNEWIAEKEFWKLVDEDTQARRQVRQAEALS